MHLAAQTRPADPRGAAVGAAAAYRELEQNVQNVETHCSAFVRIIDMDVSKRRGNSRREWCFRENP